MYLGGNHCWVPLFIENTQISDDVVLATLDVSSLYTNIPLTEGIDVFCRHYEDHYPVSIICQLTQTIYGKFTAHTWREFKFNERHLSWLHTNTWRRYGN